MKQFCGFKIGDRTRILIGVAIIGLAILFTYWPAIRGGFIWDDVDGIVRNPIITSPDGLYRLWFTSEPCDYFPLVNSLFWFEFWRWGENSLPYHVVNLLFHFLASILLWLVLSVLGVPAAWTAALIFAVHPVNVESVAWIYQQRTTLPLVLALLTIFFYFRSLDGSAPKTHWLAVTLFLLALLAKTSVVTLPVVLLLLTWWRCGRVERHHLIRILPFLLLAGIFGVVSIWFQRYSAACGEVVRSDNFFSRLAGAGWAVWFYIYKAILPINLSFVYPRWQIDAKAPISYLPLGLLIVVVGILVRHRRTPYGRNCLCGLACYLAMLFPVLGFVNIYFMKYSFVADHWQYAALPALVAMIVGGTSSLLGRSSRSRLQAGAISVVGVLLLVFLAHEQTKIYKSEETVWRNAANKNHSSYLPHYNLGVILLGQGHEVEAEKEFKEAIRRNPGHAGSHSNLGLIFHRRGEYKQAIRHYKEALRNGPCPIDVHEQLADALSSSGDLDGAVKEYLLAIGLNPRSAILHNNLATVFVKMGRLDEAIREAEIALRIQPRYANAHLNLAVALFGVGNYDEAWKHLILSRTYGLNPPEEFVAAVVQKRKNSRVR